MHTAGIGKYQNPHLLTVDVDVRHCLDRGFAAFEVLGTLHAVLGAFAPWVEVGHMGRGRLDCFDRGFSDPAATQLLEHIVCHVRDYLVVEGFHAFAANLQITSAQIGVNSFLPCILASVQLFQTCRGSILANEVGQLLARQIFLRDWLAGILGECLKRNGAVGSKMQINPSNLLREVIPRRLLLAIRPRHPVKAVLGCVADHAFQGESNPTFRFPDERSIWHCPAGARCSASGAVRAGIKFAIHGALVECVEFGIGLAV